MMLFCLTKQHPGQKNGKHAALYKTGLYSVTSFDMMRPA